MTKSELLNNTEFKNAKGDLPIIYITSDDDVVKVGGIINAPMVGRIYFSEVKKTITKGDLLANKEFICASRRFCSAMRRPALWIRRRQNRY